MGATTIQDAIAGENLVGIEPELLQQVDPGWLHRLDLFPGRALTASALQSEQSYRAGRLAILGQCVTAGTVTGLELSADLTQADPVLQIAPGYGISATGEDVALLRTMRTTLGSIPVIDPQLGSVIAAFPDYVKNASITTYAGVLLLQPITGQVSGTSVDTGTGPIVVSGNLDASCDQDPEEYAFEDWQIVDGVRLVMVAWPATPATLAIPASSPAASWRNRLVYTVFQAEMGLAPDDQLPWNLLGLPVGLIGFDNTWKAQFVDRSAVVRTGGLPRSRYVLPADAGGGGEPLLIQPALAQARVLQFNEQINAMPALTNFVPAFALYSAVWRAARLGDGLQPAGGPLVSVELDGPGGTGTSGRDRNGAAWRDDRGAARRDPERIGRGIGAAAGRALRPRNPAPGNGRWSVSDCSERRHAGARRRIAAS